MRLACTGAIITTKIEKKHSEINIIAIEQHVWNTYSRKQIVLSFHIYLINTGNERMNSI